MHLTVAAGAMPTGHYVAKFLMVDQVEHEQYGAGLRWQFAVKEGPQTGQIVSRITDMSPSPRNAAGRMLAALIGRDVRPNEEIDVDSLFGRTFMIVVGANANGLSRVETVLPWPPTIT
jgi:hypothetical protein